MTHSPEHLPDDLAAVWKAADDLLDALIHLEGHDLPDNARTELSSIIDQHAAHVWSPVCDLCKLVKP